MATTWAVFGIVLSTIVVPLPEELALLGAGYVAHGGSIPLWGAFLASWAAVILGDELSFFVGKLFLERILRIRFRGKPLVSDELRGWAERLVKGHGFRAILLGRFLVGLRGPVYLAIGASKYPAAKFAVLNGLVGLVEVGLVVYLGYLFGASRKLAHEVKYIDIGVAVVLLLFLVALPLVLKRRLHRKAQG